MKKASLLLAVVLYVVTASLAFGQGPMMQGKPSPADQARLTKLEKAYTAAKAGLAKSPKNAKAKADFASIGAAYGHESMVSPVLDPKVKYRQALKVYREVLKVDPNQPVAKKESELIISIYKSMGRPVPGG